MSGGRVGGGSSTPYLYLYSSKMLHHRPTLSHLIQSIHTTSPSLGGNQQHDLDQKGLSAKHGDGSARIGLPESHEASGQGIQGITTVACTNRIFDATRRAAHAITTPGPSSLVSSGCGWQLVPGCPPYQHATQDSRPFPLRATFCLEQGSCTRHSWRRAKVGCTRGLSVLPPICSNWTLEPGPSVRDEYQSNSA